MQASGKTEVPSSRRALTLFWYFFKIGFYTFGGGWSIVAQIQKEYVESEKWINDEYRQEILAGNKAMAVFALSS